MCEIFAVSSRYPTKITFTFDEFRRHGCDTGPHCDGWGVSYIQDSVATVYKEPEPAAFSDKMAGLLDAHEPASLLISHIRKATQGKVSLENTQPYIKELNGQQQVFVHNGNLIGIREQLKLSNYFPKGETDSEYAFCYLLDQLKAHADKADNSAISLQDKAAVIESVFNSFAQMGPANFVYTDGQHLFAFGNRRKQANGKIEAPGLHYLIRKCQKEDNVELSGVNLQTEKQSIVLIASVPLSNEDWKPFTENQLMVIKNGKPV